MLQNLGQSVSDLEFIIKIKKGTKGKVNISFPGKQNKKIDDSNQFSISPQPITNPSPKSESEESLFSRKLVYPSHAIFISCKAEEDSELEFDMRGFFNSPLAGTPTIIFDVSNLGNSDGENPFGKNQFIYPEFDEVIPLKKGDVLNIFGTGFTLKLPDKKIGSYEK